MTAPKLHTGHWQDDCGTPGPPPQGNGRASFGVPRLNAPKYRAGFVVHVSLPVGEGGGREGWRCEVYGVQLPVLPTMPASVRVRAVERLKPVPAGRHGGRGRKPASAAPVSSDGMRQRVASSAR